MSRVPIVLVALAVTGGLVGDRLAAIEPPAASAASWSSPVTLSLPVSDVLRIDGAIAMDAVGRAAAVWTDRTIPNPAVPVMAAAQDGGVWSAPVPLSPAGEIGTDVSIAMALNGVATAVWVGTPGGQVAVQSSVHVPGSPVWTAPVIVSNPFYPPTTFAHTRVGLDASGAAYAVWEYQGVWHTIQAGRRPAGGAWEAPIVISSIPGYSYLPDVAVSPSGAAVAVWQASGVPNNIDPFVVRAAYRPAGGAWSAPVNLSAEQHGTGPWNPRVAIDRAGRAVAVWSRGGIIEASWQTLPGQWSAPTLVSDPASSGNSAPVVAITRLGRPSFAWRAYDGATHSVVAVRAGEPRAQLSHAGEDAGPPQIAISPEGSLIAVSWIDNASGEVRVVTRHAGSAAWPPPVGLGLSNAIQSVVPLAVGRGALARALWPGLMPGGQTAKQVASYGPATPGR
jgi:hypothetical protein